MFGNFRKVGINNMPKETVRLSQHITDFQYKDIPGRVIDEIKLFILDYLGVALKGSTTETGEIVREFHLEYGSSKRESTIIGEESKVNGQSAAFINAVSSHSIELDDVDVLALFHSGPPILSAALAAAEANDASGKELLSAVVLGVDILKRLSGVTNPSLRDRGFHTTPVCGVFGATAAVSRLEKLSAEETASALGIAGAHAAGLMEMYGPSMQKRINPGPAAYNGVVSARLAKRGYTGADTILEGERGFLKSFAGQNYPAKLVENLGVFDLGIEYKRYACARPIHNAVDCALEVRGHVRNKIDQIKEMVIWRHPSWADYHQIANPKSMHEAQMSLNHAVAVSLVEGDAFLDEFSDQWINHESVNRLSNLLQFKVEPKLKRGVSCKLQVTLDSGEQFESVIDYSKGSIKNPMTNEDHWVKFQKLTQGTLTKSNMNKVKDLVENIDSQTSIKPLMDLMK